MAFAKVASVEFWDIRNITFVKVVIDAFEITIVLKVQKKKKRDSS